MEELSKAKTDNDNREVDEDIEENGETENPTRSAIDELIQEDSKLKESIRAAQESKRKWCFRCKAIHSSNWKLELELKRVRDRVEHLQNEIVEKSDKSQKSHDELELYKSRGKKEAADFWTYFQGETQKYSHSFVNAHKEYGSNNLRHDIETYRRNAEIENEKITKMQKEIEELKAQYGLAEMGTNEDAKLLADIDTAKKIISDNSLLLDAIKSTEEKIQVLKLKAKQKKDEIAYLKKKL